MNKSARVGIFGGTFNPVHLAHLRMAEEAAEALRLEKVIFVPAGVPPFKRKRAKVDMVSADERARMVRMAIRGNPLFELSILECKGEGVSYTVDTLESFSSRGDMKLYLIMGLDAFMEFHLWRRPERILELAELAVVSRPVSNQSGKGAWPMAEKSPFVSRGSIRKALGSAKGGKKPVSIRLRPSGTLYLINATGMDISATGIRARIRDGKSVRYLLPQRVESFIMTRNLYGKKEEFGQRKEKFC